MQNNSSSITKLLLFTLASFIFLGGLFFYQQSKFSDGNLRLVFCDVGQGDGIYIRSPRGVDILVDGGPDDKILSCLSGNMPFWDKTIEVVILTHPHADHAVGLISVLKRYTVLQFYTEEVGSETSVYRELSKVLSDKKLQIKTLKKGDLLRLKDGLLFSTLSPIKEQLDLAKSKKNIDLDENGLSVVQLMTYGQFSLLLTGDSILNDSISQKVDILKVPHHGSRNNISRESLALINPKLAIIQSGQGNSYGHPHKETLNILEELGIKLLRNDLDGEIEVLSDGKKFWLVR